ncbi:MAG TPA: UDP-glucose/GDP-mannose dehydrogenase family protein [Vicinamibacteria bacterium]|nr:UDP-glucose/GDP-mannose dehydrogenase family protein [Vicinamibacteria bacterium]
MKISVVGTGYVGLVVSACLAENGNHVIAVDIDEAKIEKLRRGEIPIYEPGLEELVKRNVLEERLSYTTDFDSAVHSSKILFVAVGTPAGEDGSADMSHVIAVSEGIGRAMNEDKIVVLKSTVPIGTNRRVRDTIAKFTRHPFNVVSNPEFLKEGAAIEDFLRPDRVVIGTDDEKVAAVMEELYRPFVRTGNPVMVMDPESAELTKYAANAMLATRISFMNEMARLCERVGADVAQLRRAVGADRRIGHAFLFPGVGYGGSCFPKDIRALLRTARDVGMDLALVDATEQVNSRQKMFLLEKIRDYFANDLNGKTVAVWGLSFKPRTDDMREAPSLTLIRGLASDGARIRAFDPEAMVEARKQLEDVDGSITYCTKSYEACHGADALVLVTEWNEFREPDFERVRGLLRRPVVFDGRNIYNPSTLKALGFTYFGIGRS